MSFSTIRTKVRDCVQEFAQAGKDVFIYDASRVFKLSDLNIQSINSVFKNDVEVSESGNWSFDEDTNRLTFVPGYSLTSGDVLEVNYTSYPNYSDSEINSYIKAAVTNISVYKYKTFKTITVSSADVLTPEPTEEEENLIALIAGVLIKPGNRTYKLPDMMVQVPINSLPTEAIIKQIIASFKKSGGVFSLIVD